MALSLLLGAASVAYSQDTDSEEDDVFELSPFEVSPAGTDVGYRATNTLMGTRLNTNIGDLASSITVVTKQQLDDTASLDINDVFLYEANTEGANNYTAYHINRGYIKDEGAGISADNGTPYSAATSNRIRGLSAADASQNNYPAIARIPFDTYNTQTVEINRGPNSMLFGTGSPSGIVNQSTANAMIGNDGTEVTARIGSWDAWRLSFNHNQTIIEDKLAVYVAALHDERGYRRKPSYNKTDRQYFSFTYKPGEKTTFRGNIENYTNDARTPNTVAPRDGVTPWFQAGRPVYDNNRDMIVYLDSGEEFGPLTYNANAENYNPRILNPDYNSDDPNKLFTDRAVYDTDGAFFTGVLTAMPGNDTMYIYEDGTSNFQVHWLGVDRPAEPDAGTDAYNTYWDNRDRRLLTTTVPWVEPWVNPNVVPYYNPGLIDSSIYDWEHVNLSAPNFQSSEAKTYNLEFQHTFNKDLSLQVGWFKQDMDSVENNTIANVRPTEVLVDVNMYRLDGSPNPGYLKPYINDYGADTFTNPEVNDNVRAQLYYHLDMTDRDNWARWFGDHQFSAIYSQHERTSSRTRSRMALVDDGGTSGFLPDDGSDAEGYSYAARNWRIRRYYYLGDDGMVTQGNTGNGGNPGTPWGTGAETQYSANYMQWNTDSSAQWQTAPLTLDTLLWWPSSGRAVRELDSNVLGLHSKFWEGKIVTTLGWREDTVKNTRYGDLVGEAPFVNGYLPEDMESYYFENFLLEEELKGETSTKGIVIKPTNWVSLTYNESDNFNPPTNAATDFFGNPLPYPSGNGKDYGIRFNLFENKLHASVNFFENTDENARGVPSVFIGRTHNIDNNLMRSWASHVVRIRDGEDPTTEEYWAEDYPGITPAQEQAVAEIMGLPWNFPTGLSIDATQSRSAEGMEIQLVYNPKDNWTMKFTGGRQETVISNVAPEWSPWIDERMPIWQSASATDLEEVYVAPSGRELSLRNFWTAYGYRGSEIEPNHRYGWNSTADYFQVVVADEVTSVRATEGLVAPGQREWRFNFLTNYKFTEGRFKGLSIGGSARWEDAGSIGNYGIVGEDGVMRQADVFAPIYGDEEFHVDLWASYAMPIGDDMNLKLQLNVRDALEDGGLQAVAANYDGSVWGYRYIDPRQIFLTSTLEF